MLEILRLVLGFFIILVGAELFTNGVEWFGIKLSLKEAAVGSLLAAVGTALPESAIPLIAIFLTPGADVSHIGIGTILGAPFMLGTLAFFVIGITALLCRRGAAKPLRVDAAVLKRDISFFMVVFSLSIVSSFLPQSFFKLAIPIALIAIYLIYAFLTARSGASISFSSARPLFISRSRSPSMFAVIVQLTLGLTCIVFGANAFIGFINHYAGVWGVNPMMLALVIAPVATELPEKYNSVLWMRRGRDTLALGNVTGAMVFQSSIIPAIGILFTSWVLEAAALVSAALVLLSTGCVLFFLRRRGYISPIILLSGGFFYALFVLFLVLG